MTTKALSFSDFPIGAFVDVKTSESATTQYSGPAVVLQHDSSDPNLPMLVDKWDEAGQQRLDQPFWIGFAEATLESSGGLKTPGPDVAPDVALDDSVELLAERLDADLIRAGALATVVVQKLRASKPKHFAPGGVCAACMGDVAFDIQTGVWSHAKAPDEKHSIPTVIIGASKEV